MEEIREREHSSLSAEEEQLLNSVLNTITNNPTTENTIPTNSNSILVNQATSRFSSAIWYEKIQQKSITLAGLGGIGSYVAFLLSRMQPKELFLYDNDIVETVNLSGQLYSINHVNKPKISAISEIMSKFSLYDRVFAFNNRFDIGSNATEIMICGFDNMYSRKLFFNKWYTLVKYTIPYDRKHCLFVDGRLTSEYLQIFCIRGDDTYNIKRYYDNYLFSDEEAEETVCSNKQTSFMANMIGSLITNLFVNFCANECNPVIPRDLPFLTEYNAELMYLKTEA